MSMKSSSVLKILIFNWVSVETEEQRVTAEHTHTHRQICGTRWFIVCGSLRLSLSSLSLAVDSHQLSPSLTTWMLRGRWSSTAWNCTMLGWVTGPSYPTGYPLQTNTRGLNDIRCHLKQGMDPCFVFFFFFFFCAFRLVYFFVLCNFAH